VVAKFVPWLLSQEQKDFRAKAAPDLLEIANKYPDFPKKFITGNETSVRDYGPETKAQSSHWKSPEFPRSKKARPSRINVEDMLTAFFFTMKVLSNTSTLLQDWK
jgi:hypothetical protein